MVRFGRAGSRCERCSRPHLEVVHHLGDGRWFDHIDNVWRDGRGRRTNVVNLVPAALRRTRVVLACAHLDHNPGNNKLTNLAALCQRCHMLHDAGEHRRQRAAKERGRRALGDLFDRESAFFPA